MHAQLSSSPCWSLRTDLTFINAPVASAFSNTASRWGSRALAQAARSKSSRFRNWLVCPHTMDLGTQPKPCVIHSSGTGGPRSCAYSIMAASSSVFRQHPEVPAFSCGTGNLLASSSPDRILLFAGEPRNQKHYSGNFATPVH